MLTQKFTILLTFKDALKNYFIKCKKKNLTRGPINLTFLRLDQKFKQKQDFKNFLLSALINRD